RYVRDPEYMQPKGSKIDACGIGFLALGLGCLQVALDTGQRKDWWGSRDIRILAVLCVFGLLAFVIREFMTKDPVVQFRAFRDRAFAVGAWLHGVLGFVLYASLLLVPLYLQTLLGFPAVRSGLAVSPFGIGALIALPIAGVLLNRFDPRKLLVLGFGGAAASMFLLSGLNLNAGYWDVFWPEIVLGLGTGFMYTPLAAASLSHLPKEEMGNATSIVNLLRNIGGSVGIAMMETVVSRRTQVHQHRLSEHIAFNDPLVRQMLQQFTAYFRQQGADIVTATQRAYGALYLQLQQHAAMLAFVEAFWCLGVICAVVVPSFVFLRNSQARLKSEPEEAATVSTHSRRPQVFVHP
ncbi:MAG TPA: DHA2 family efflux MFS transporter permease subunit, partial [Terriglobales bacterium]